MERKGEFVVGSINDLWPGPYSNRVQTKTLRAGADQAPFTTRQGPISHRPAAADSHREDARQHVLSQNLTALSQACDAIHRLLPPCECNDIGWLRASQRFQSASDSMQKAVEWAWRHGTRGTGARGTGLFGFGATYDCMYGFEVVALVAAVLRFLADGDQAMEDEEPTSRVSRTGPSTRERSKPGTAPVIRGRPRAADSSAPPRFSETLAKSMAGSLVRSGLLLRVGKSGLLSGRVLYGLAASATASESTSSGNRRSFDAPDMCEVNLPEAQPA